MKKYKSDICKVMHQDAVADYEVGGITEEKMRYYDEKCLVEEPKPGYGKRTTSNCDITMVAERNPQVKKAVVTLLK